MFTITVAAAVVIINKSDLAPVLEEFTRSPPVITRAVTRQEATSSQGVRPHLFFCVKGGRGSVRTVPSAHVTCLPASVPIGLRIKAEGLGSFGLDAQHCPRGTWTGRLGEQGAAHPLTAQRAQLGG